MIDHSWHLISIAWKLSLVIAGSAIVVAIVEGGSVYMPLWAAIAVVVSASVPPMLNAWARRRDRLAQWRREDEREEARLRRERVVADRVAQVATTAETVAEKVAQVAVVADQTNGQIDSIHKLVDGQQTTLMQAELDAKNALLVVLKENVELKRRSRKNATLASTRKIITNLENQIEALSNSIATRQMIMANERKA